MLRRRLTYRLSNLWLARKSLSFPASTFRPRPPRHRWLDDLTLRRFIYRRSYARALLEGLSSAIISTFGPTLLVDIVSQKEIGKTIGYFSLYINLAVLIGPVLSGIIFA
jgi:MFS family permease